MVEILGVTDVVVAVAAIDTIFRTMNEAALNMATSCFINVFECILAFYHNSRAFMISNSSTLCYGACLNTSERRRRRIIVMME